VTLLGVPPASASGPPAITEEFSHDVGYTTATAYAVILPQGEETTFHVEYGTTTSYGASAPVPDSSAGSSTERQEVNVPLSGLRPGATYHYRFVASSQGGTVEGPDETFTTFAPSPPAAADTCPNAAYRKGLSANLPDCRAYEMVSPVDKNGADVVARTHRGETAFVSSLSGNRIVYGTRTAFGDAKGSGFGGYSQNMATRGADGWTTKGITPTPALNDPTQFFIALTAVFDFSSEFDRAVTLGYDLPGATGAPPSTESLYLEDIAAGSKLLEPVTRFEGFQEPYTSFSWKPELGGSSSDMGVVTFQMNQNLVPQAKGSSPKVYMLDHGAVRLVSILPDGSLPAEATLVRDQHESIAFKDTVSSDGSRVYFFAIPEGGERQLYLRKNGSSTALVSESEASEPSKAQNVNFQAATPDGTKVVFSTSTRLLDSDPGGPGTALYLYSDSANPKVESNLTYIARFSGEYEGLYRGAAQVVKGLSDDGSHIYFDSAPTETLPFKTQNEGLFLWDSGQIKQVAPDVTLGEGVFESLEEDEAIVSRDGRQIAFLNRYSTVHFSSMIAEVYLYDEGEEKLRCVSCPQTGAAPVGGIEYQVQATGETNPTYKVDGHPRFFSRDGRYVFFNTSDALLPQDTNKLSDVYEYDVATGKQWLLSSGTGETGTWFADASPDGRDVFLVTRQQLNGWDPDKLDDLYDARIGSTLPEPPHAGTPCSGDGCQGVPAAAPSFNTASEFNGLGNPTVKPVAKGKGRTATRAQRLKRALAACRKKPRHKRAACESAARKRYAAKKSAERATRVGR
jgi:hypothetical protein